MRDFVVESVSPSQYDASKLQGESAWRTGYAGALAMPVQRKFGYDVRGPKDRKTNQCSVRRKSHAEIFGLVL
jgi:hypothetical protein